MRPGLSASPQERLICTTVPPEEACSWLRYLSGGAVLWITQPDLLRHRSSSRMLLRVSPRILPAPADHPFGSRITHHALIQEAAEEETRPGAARPLLPWPGRMAEQAQAVRGALAAAPPDHAVELLETLVTSGRARGWRTSSSATPPPCARWLGCLHPTTSTPMHQRAQEMVEDEPNAPLAHAASNLCLQPRLDEEIDLPVQNRGRVTGFHIRTQILHHLIGLEDVGADLVAPAGFDVFAFQRASSSSRFCCSMSKSLPRSTFRADSRF